MANQLLNEIFTEDKLVQLWPDFPCLYDVQSSDFKNRDLRQQAMEAIATQVEQSGAYFVVVCVEFVNKIRIGSLYLPPLYPAFCPDRAVTCSHTATTPSQ